MPIIEFINHYSCLILSRWQAKVSWSSWCCHTPTRSLILCKPTWMSNDQLLYNVLMREGECANERENMHESYSTDVSSLYNMRVRRTQMIYVVAKQTSCWNTEISQLIAQAPFYELVLPLRERESIRLDWLLKDTNILMKSIFKCSGELIIIVNNEKISLDEWRVKFRLERLGQHEEVFLGFKARNGRMIILESS